jgi:hypothetical protein
MENNVGQYYANFKICEQFFEPAWTFFEKNKFKQNIGGGDDDLDIEGSLFKLQNGMERRNF